MGFDWCLFFSQRLVGYTLPLPCPTLPSPVSPCAAFRSFTIHPQPRQDENGMPKQKFWRKEEEKKKTQTSRSGPSSVTPTYTANFYLSFLSFFSSLRREIHPQGHFPPPLPPSNSPLPRHPIAIDQPAAAARERGHTIFSDSKLCLIVLVGVVSVLLLLVLVSGVAGSLIAVSPLSARSSPQYRHACTQASPSLPPSPLSVLPSFPPVRLVGADKHAQSKAGSGKHKVQASKQARKQENKQARHEAQAKA